MGVYRNCPVFFFGGGVPPTISGTGKATDFKFGRYIYRENPNKSLLKLRTSNFVGTFIESIRTKAREKCWE